jgi:HlyD family secretion protein
MTRAKWLGVAVSGTVLVGIFAWAVHKVPEVEVETALVTTGPITRSVVAAGSVQAVTTVEVGAQVSGIVQSVAVDFNSVVRAGQVVARLDPSFYQAALSEVQANLLQAEAASGRAQADLTGSQTAEADAREKFVRAQALAAEDLVTKADFDAAGAALAEAGELVRAQEAEVRETRAAIDQARAAVDQASVNLHRTVITSPIDGIVIDRDVDVGQTLAATVQAPVLFRIASDLTHVQVRVDIDESDIAGLAEGEAATFEVETYPDRTFRGTVAQLRIQPVAEQTATVTTVATSSAPSTSSEVATVVGYTVVIDVANPDERLRPGMTAEVVLAGAHRPTAIRIPNSALAFRPPAEVLAALGEIDPSAPGSIGVSADDGTRSGAVWEYDGKRFTPIAVHLALANNEWTELVGGSIRPGDALVTRAVVRRHSRL